ncbi:MAG: SGNH/GDSL hydrolase family protein [bacterium]
MTPSPLISVLLLLVVGLAVYCYWYVRKFLTRIRRSREITEHTTPFSRPLTGAAMQVLFMGDSTAVGVGASEGLHTTAGRFSAAYPEASILNVGKSGSRLADLASFPPPALLNGQYDLIIAQIGANDILRLTPLASAEESLRQIIRQALKHTKKLVLLHGGNVGSADIIPWVFRGLFSRRTRAFRDLYTRVCTEEGAHYVDMYTSLKDFPSIRNGVSTYSKDSFHPSDEGYAIWFELIQEVLNMTA